MKQAGFVLVVSLIFLAILTMLGISMFTGFSSDETLSGNYREKSRSIDAAQTALNYAQNWMTIPGNTYTGNWVTGTTCTAPTTTPTVCNNVLATPQNLSWLSYSTYTPNNLSTTAGLKTYASIPKFYIVYLGNADPYNAFYQVTSTAQGGNAAAVTVLQTVYKLHATASYLGGG